MNRSRKSEMNSEWRSWEHLIRDDLKRIEHRIQKCYDGMQRVGIGRVDRESFVLGKVAEMIQEIAEVA